jgi:pyruvate,orthophosphate dikinase
MKRLWENEMPSKALEINIETSRVDVAIGAKYALLQEVMSKYSGLMEGLNIFLKELEHPYKNWEFIVNEARGFALEYFHLLQPHPKGTEAACLYLDIFFDAIENSQDREVRTNAVDNLILYLQKVIRDSGKDFNRFLSFFDDAFDRISSIKEEQFFLFVTSYYQLNKLAEAYVEKAPPDVDLSRLISLLSKYFQGTYSCWQEEEDPETWFKREAGLSESQVKVLKTIFFPVSHEQLNTFAQEAERISQETAANRKNLLGALKHLPGYRQIVEGYREIPKELFKIGESTGQGNNWKLIFLFHIMNTAGLSSIHEESLRDINRTLAWLIGHERLEVVQEMIEKTFAILKISARKYPVTALNAVLNVGRAVYKTDDSDLVDFFIDAVVALGFQTPGLRGLGDDWQIRANAAHIQNIRTWLELIEQNPKWSKKLISSLIIHLTLSGVFIKDTDLFPRDITKLLNSDVGAVYNLVKQLSRLFPAYFNDIGAEGKLRDISTRIDEISQRKDVLIHFLRKQSHVESSNQIVGLMVAILEFWRTRDKKILKPFIPPNIYSQIETEGPYIDGVHRLFSHLFKVEKLSEISNLLELKNDSFKESLKDITDVPQNEVERLELGITLYKLLYEKYFLSFLTLEDEVKQLQTGAFPDLEKLKEALSESDQSRKVFKLLSYLEHLKDLILSPQAYEIREQIYHKRHFAVDIPSMYGSYREAKFDALGLTFRLESLVNILFEDLVETIDLSLITRATFTKIYDYLSMFDRALKLDGIPSTEMERQLDLLARSLAVREFSFTQYLDVFRGFSEAVNNIVNDYFDNIHKHNLKTILAQMPPENLLSNYQPKGKQEDQESLIHRVSEIFLRERISSSLGLQQVDLFLSRIMNTLFQQAERLPKESLRLLLNYDPQRAITPMKPVRESLSDFIYLGNKGMNLVKLNNYGVPVPPGFIITTEIFRYFEIIDNYTPANNNLREQIAYEISRLEKISGRHFGNPERPLLLSVRSGATISQPGMMNTFLDVGMNEEIAQGIVAGTGQEWFAWDCYRRFLQTYGMSFGLNRNDFDDVITGFKNRLGVQFKRDFSGGQMKKVALAYKELIRHNGIPVEESPFEQLYIAIKKVFDSWNATKAKTYRKIMGISDDWGTAVSVQQMVFGNLSQQAGSGVVFTHNPRLAGDMIMLWGDFTLGNQGEDVVSGLVNTLPISQKQVEMENREVDITLETHFSPIYHAIRDLSKHLIYDERWGPQEMEFTFEAPSKEALYLLQTRDMAIRERAKVKSFLTSPKTEKKLIGHGIGVSGGAMTGRVVFKLEEIRQWRGAEPATALILVRGDTVPDDIMEINEADGLLTARGGATSHAAIVAHRLGKTCVVGAFNLLCMEKESSATINEVSLKAGAWMSIDGRSGAIYSGKVKIKEA